MYQEQLMRNLLSQFETYFKKVKVYGSQFLECLHAHIHVQKITILRNQISIKKKKIHITVCGLKLEKQTHITAIAEYTIYFLNPKIILDSRDYLKKKIHFWQLLAQKQHKYYIQLISNMTWWRKK